MEAIRMGWLFLQDQVLGMKRLNALIGDALTAMGLSLNSILGGALQFFIYDTIKIFLLLSVLIFGISYLQSYFPPERTKKILGRFHGIGANTVAALPQIPGAAIGLAMITVVGQCIGAGEQDQAKSYTLRLTGLAYASMSVLCILEVVLVAPIVGFFNLSAQTAELARQLLVYHGITCLIMWPASFVLPNGLRAAGDVRFTMLVSVLSMWVFRIGFSYLLVDMLHMGVLGVWVAMTIDWLVRVIVFSIRLFTGGWRNKHLI